MTVMTVGKPGRPPIGPKAQTHIPQDHFDQIDEEAQQRGILRSDVLREVIADGLELRSRTGREA